VSILDEWSAFDQSIEKSGGPGSLAKGRLEGAPYLLNLGYDRDGQPSVPHAQPIADDQMIVSFNALPERIASGEVLSATDAQLATLATACTQRLTQRAQHREKQAAKPGLPTAQAAPDLLMMTFK
ncbi:MAG: hypothetical protein RSD57_19880, partial [Comamonas sp.]